MSSRVDLSPLLEDLESRLDECVEESLLEQWRRFCQGQWSEPVFDPRRGRGVPARIEWPRVRINEALDSFEAMAAHQLADCSRQVEAGSGALLCIRANFGTPILAVPFGCELFRMPDETDTLPACHTLPGGADGIRAALQREPSLDHPYLQRVFETTRRFVALLAPYPKLRRFVHIYHPDLQGPMDVLELLWGSDMFVGLLDEPDLAHAMLRRITAFYEKVMLHWRTIVPPVGDTSTHWGWMQPGQIMLRDDSAMNLSGEMFEEFVAPYDQALLRALGGGAMHACGRIGHFIASAAGLDGLRAFNMSQPQLNDLSRILSQTVERGVLLLGLHRAAAQQAMADGHDLRGRVHVC